jgi:thioredoxin 1
MKLIKFHATWCGPCKALSQVMENCKDKWDVPVAEIDIDADRNIAMEYGIRSVPTLILVDEYDNQLKRHSGSMKESEFLEFVKV